MKRTRIVVGLSIILFVLNALFTALSYVFFLPPEIPLFYSLARPQDHLAQKEWVFVFPVLSLSFILLHGIVALFDKDEDRFGTLLSGMMSFFLQILFFISLIRILVLVT